MVTYITDDSFIQLAAQLGSGYFKKECKTCSKKNICFWNHSPAIIYDMGKKEFVVKVEVNDKSKNCGDM